MLIGRRAEPGDLAGALRNPALLSAVDSLLRGEAAGGPELTRDLPGEYRVQPVGNDGPGPARSTSPGSTGRRLTARSRC